MRGPGRSLSSLGLPVAIAVLLAAMLVVAIFVLYVLPGISYSSTPGSDCCPSGPSPVPIAAALLLGPPAESSTMDHHWYNLSVEEAAPGVGLSDLAFRVQEANGAIV